MESLRQKLSFLLVAGSLLIIASGAHASSTVEVGTCISGLVQFSTIQSAVNQSPAGTTIEVCPGQYPEQVSINKKLTIHGVASAGQNAAVVVAPNGGVVQNTTDVDTGNPIAAQILVVSPAVDVTLGDLVVDGSNNGISGCSPDLQGILFQNASGVISHVTARNQYLSPEGANGCQSGEGIYVQTASGSTSTLTVENASVHDYQKNGITGNDSGTTLNVSGSRVQGFGVVQPPAAAQNGIQLGFGAKGNITHNMVVDDVYGDINVAIATGILLYDTVNDVGIKVENNIVANTQGAVVLYTGQDDGNGNLGNGVTVKLNNIFATVNYDAIDVCTDGNTIQGNTIYDSSESGVHLDGSCSLYGSESTGNGNSATQNKITDSECAGVLVDSGTTGNTTSPDTYYGVPYTVLHGSCPARPGHAKSTTKRLYSPKGRK
jgi:hypothetical protein